MANQDRDRFQKEIEVEVQKIDASFQKISVKVPQDARGEFENLRTAVKGLVERYRNQPTQLPADPNDPTAGHDLPQGGSRPTAGQDLPQGGKPSAGQDLPPTAQPKKY